LYLRKMGGGVVGLGSALGGCRVRQASARTRPMCSNLSTSVSTNPRCLITDAAAQTWLTHTHAHAHAHTHAHADTQTQTLDRPVSRRTVKGWRGEPIEMLARKAVRESLMTTGT
jgi:hypothetical protein